jgi:hypothetical protein
MEISQPELARLLHELARSSFLDGIKATLITAQINHLGVVLCAECGRSWDRSHSAFIDLELESIITGPSVGYRGGPSWGMDHPNNFRLTCRSCMA